jgi:PAS domain-containing protein
MGMWPRRRSQIGPLPDRSFQLSGHRGARSAFYRHVGLDPDSGAGFDERGDHYVERLAVAVGWVSVAIVLCGMVGAMTDRQLADRADLETRRLKQLANASFEGIVIHCDGVIRDCNRAFARMVGRLIDELIGRPALDFDVPSGPLRPVEVLSRPIEFGGRTGFVSAVRDLTEQKRAEQKIRHLAHHDALTEVCNRRALADRTA